MSETTTLEVFSEIVPRDITAAEVAAKHPVGIILSGGPASVYAEAWQRVSVKRET